MLETIRDFLDYDWLRALHILSVIAWMAGLLMYPRLIIYRIEGKGNPGQQEQMDKALVRLRKIILSPSMHSAWLFGLLLVWQNWSYLSGEVEFWAKVVLVSGLSWLHFFFTRLAKKATSASAELSSKKLRIINEIPFIIAIPVVVIAIVYL